MCIENCSSSPPSHSSPPRLPSILYQYTSRDSLNIHKELHLYVFPIFTHMVVCASGLFTSQCIISINKEFYQYIIAFYNNSIAFIWVISVRKIYLCSFQSWHLKMKHLYLKKERKEKWRSFLYI